MDIFCEYILKKGKKITDYLLSAALGLAAVLLTFIVMLFYNYTYGFGLFIICAVWYGAYFLIKSRNIEFEYALTNNEMDIDKIIARRRRKRLITIDFKHIDICANIEDDMYKHMFSNTAAVTKTYDCTGLSENDIYFVDFAGENGKTRVLFQPTEKMKESLKLINPREIHIS